MSDANKLGSLLEIIKKKPDEEDQIVTMLTFVMSECGYTLDELKEMPIPTFMILCQELSKKYKNMPKIGRGSK